MNYPNFDEEKKLWKKGYNFVAGLDEAGRGPLAGPVVAGAVIINPKHGILISDLKIRDSKQMSANQREDVYEKITVCKDITWGVGIVSEKVIDKINILEATKLAMQKAINNLLSRNPRHKLRYRAKSDDGLFLLIDGNMNFGWGYKYKSIIKGDQKVFSISAASIIAKVTRDRIMRKYHKKYPNYGFDKHKGYGTKYHQTQLSLLGPSAIHRHSFAPVRKML